MSRGNRTLRSVRMTGIALMAALALAGCRVEVYDGLSQRDANEMTALLISAGIDASRKSAKKGGTFAVTVDEDDFAQAVKIISRSGLPKQQFATIVDVLSDDRLIASPSEERARLNYALSQELSRTVSEIDGIVSARVHLATPNDEPLARKNGLSSASVAIHHHKDFNTAGFVPRIKMLVANAVDGLEYDKVSIALFPSSELAYGWQNPKPALDAEFEAPKLLAPESQSEMGSDRVVTPAMFSGDRLDPAVIAILGGGFVVLLLAGHTILTGRRGHSTTRESSRRSRHRPEK